MKLGLKKKRAINLIIHANVQIFNLNIEIIKKINFVLIKSLKFQGNILKLTKNLKCSGLGNNGQFRYHKGYDGKRVRRERAQERHQRNVQDCRLSTPI